MVAAFRANRVPEAQIAAFVAQRQQHHAAHAPAVRLHPLNQPVLLLLPLTEGCWVFTQTGHRAGYRYADAHTLLEWHNVPADVRKRLPIAVNAILRG